MEEQRANYRFFSHTNCEFFPCHEGVAKETFNCLFCYCPLYLRGEHCGGDFTLLENGMKDCTNCVFPHKKENYEEMLGRLYEK